MSKPVTTCQNVSKAVKSGQKWSKTVKNGQKRSEMVKNFGDTLGDTLRDTGDTLGTQIQSTSEHYQIKNPTGFCINILTALEKEFNFTSQFFARSDGVWGMPFRSNGTWKVNGIVGDLSRNGDFDLGIELAVLYSRDHS